ncbi:uncharacterized protein F4822DRAFT_423476 [Hypoxylon trugodes]|uniref:uncharacterized protein n=1 Tax=Hypoxylon trugodes TaxID=326681 RepID=UPI00219C2DD2|nr:uncharacterized protein F4822DRAFT_423476 [Hypoxylon trugodes]KAI1382563.1 hypothetical protein F4822DRAFT_423476 [Hypoxylon trugodes]
MTREGDSKNRRFGLAKKADAYSRLFAANTAVIIEDQGQFYLYTSCPKFVPELLATLNVRAENKFEPGTFESVSDLKKRSPSPSLGSESSSTLSSQNRQETPLANPTTSLNPRRRPSPHKNGNKHIKGTNALRKAPQRLRASGAVGRLLKSDYFK